MKLDFLADYGIMREEEEKECHEGTKVQRPRRREEEEEEEELKERGGNAAFVTFFSSS